MKVDIKTEENLKCVYFKKADIKTENDLIELIDIFEDFGNLAWSQGVGLQNYEDFMEFINNLKRNNTYYFKIGIVKGSQYIDWGILKK